MDKIELIKGQILKLLDSPDNPEKLMLCDVLVKKLRDFLSPKEMSPHEYNTALKELRETGKIFNDCIIHLVL